MPEPYSQQTNLQGMIRSARGDERYRFLGLGGLVGRSSRKKARSVPAKPWYRRASTWSTSTILGTVIAGILVAVIVAVILKFANFNSSSQSANSVPISSPSSRSPVTARSGFIKVNVSTVAPDGGFGVVFPNLYDLTSWQKSHSDTYNALESSIPQLYQSFKASGGADLGSFFITMTFTNTSDQIVDIVDASIVDRILSAPWTGTLISFPAQGYVSNIKINFDLDRVVPVADGKGDQPFFANGNILLPPGVPTTVLILASTTSHAVSFRIQFEYVVNGVHQAIIVGQGAKPFTVSAFNCKTSPYRRIYGLVQPQGIIEQLTPKIAAEYGLCMSP
jgi:hypothetical protein